MILEVRKMAALWHYVSIDLVIKLINGIKGL